MKFMIYQKDIFKKTKGFCDIADITPDVSSALKESGINEGICLIFIPGSTAAITTIENETGVIRDLQKFVEKLIPQNIAYEHNSRWGDGNGFSHVRASFFKASLSVPVSANSLMLGTWQQIVMIDFDNRSRDRHIIIKIMGE